MALTSTFRRTGPQLCTGKCTVEISIYAGQPAVKKRLRALDPFWIDRFRHEARWYEHFRIHPPPVRVPRLLAVNTRRRILIISRARGAPLSPARYVSGALPSADFRLLLQTLDRLHRWRPHPTASAAQIRRDYLARFEKYVASGALPLDDRLVEQVAACVGFMDWRPEFNHGDLLPGNALWERGTLTLLDWEFAGWFLPGYDLALLWLLLPRDPAAREQIECAVAARRSLHQTGFLLNQLLLIGRETRIHQAEPPSHARDEILAQLKCDLSWVAAQAGGRSLT